MVEPITKLNFSQIFMYKCQISKNMHDITTDNVIIISISRPTRLIECIMRVQMTSHCTPQCIMHCKSVL